MNTINKTLDKAKYFDHDPSSDKRFGLEEGTTRRSLDYGMKKKGFKVTQEKKMKNKRGEFTRNYYK